MRTKHLWTLLVILMLVACQPTPNQGNNNNGEINSNIPTNDSNANNSTDKNTDTGDTDSNEPDLYTIAGVDKVLQIGNDASKYKLVTQPAQNLPDTHTGPWIEDYGRYSDSDFVYNNGFTRMRIGAIADWGAADQEWPINEDTLLPRVDEKITEYADNGIRLMLTTPLGAELYEYPPNFKDQEQVDALEKYLAFVASHFKGRITYYEILNEAQYMTPQEYVDITEQAIDAIWENDPDAGIIIGAVADDAVFDYPGYGKYVRKTVDSYWLFEMTRRFNFDEYPVDGISWHPLYDPLPSDPYYQNYPVFLQRFREFAASRGFYGEFFADEILWAGADEENWDNGPPTPIEIAAKYQARTITEHRAFDVNVTINQFWQMGYIHPVKYLNNVIAGAEPIDLPITLESNEGFDHIRAYGFSLPDGDVIAAIWINDTAVKEDPGLNFTLTMPGFSADSVTGIDIYYGFTQELVMENIDNQLVIQNLMVKDYPTIVRFHNPVLENENPVVQLPPVPMIVVENTEDSGPGSFRQALLDAQSGDTITFDPEVFDPANPATIFLLSELPEINHHFLTIDASNAGVILDGSQSNADGFTINSEWNSIMGLHIINFPGTGIVLNEFSAKFASFSKIGGDPNQGAGPLGQGNLISGNNAGIILDMAQFNKITGNQIGVEMGGIKGNEQSGIFFIGLSMGNIIGPDNIITNNGAGVYIYTEDPFGNTITQNAIYNNGTNLQYDPGNPSTPDAPVIQSISPDGTVTGMTCAYCRVEIFSGDGAGAEFYEGSVMADADGNFSFTAGNPISGNSIIATATTYDGFTSNFSEPVAKSQ
ncbi:MAG: cellulase family glycosylhydrolase [Anaerolineales bacterium]